MELAVAREMHDLINHRTSVDHRRMRNGQGQVISLSGQMGGRNADFAIIGRAEHKAWKPGLHRPVTGNDAQRIIDGAKGLFDRGPPAGAQCVPSAIQDGTMEAQPIEEIGDLAATIGCP